MSRDIEFRGWDPDTKRWYYGSYVRLERSTPYPMSQTPEADAKKFEDEQVDHYIFFTEDNDWGLPTRKVRATVDPKSVGQYTGVGDKKHRRIYEGDVIRDESGRLWAVSWEDDYPGFYLRDGDSTTGMECDYQHDGQGKTRPFEVIGNIYEDPDLLESAA